MRNPVPANTTSCPRCGTALAARATAGTTTAFRFDPSRLSSAERLTGIGALVLLTSLFLPWYGVTVLGFSAQADGLTGHGYLSAWRDALAPAAACLSQRTRWPGAPPAARP